jgi:hypothetical protein
MKTVGHKTRLFTFVSLLVLFATSAIARDDPKRGEFEDITTRGPWVDVRSFGAKGDGTTDDTAAIQKAVDYCQEEGKPLYFGGKGRHYKVTETIKVTVPINAYGDGAEIVQ